MNNPTKMWIDKACNHLPSCKKLLTPSGLVKEVVLDKILVKHWEYK
jgi:hypothetical protein